MSGTERPVGNLKPAPLALTADVVAKLVGDRPPFGKSIVHLPNEGKVCCRVACEAADEPDDIDWMGGGLLF